MRRNRSYFPRAILVAAVLSFGACAHQQSTPDVTVMRTGPLYDALPNDCPLTFLNNQHMDILASGYEQLAMIIFSGSPRDMERASSAIPGAVAVGACKLGGDSVSLANTMDTGRSAAMQFVVWKAPASKPAGSGTGKPANSGQGI